MTEPTDATQDDTELRMAIIPAYIPVAPMDVAPELFASGTSTTNQTEGGSQ